MPLSEVRLAIYMETVEKIFSRVSYVMEDL